MTNHFKIETVRKTPKDWPLLFNSTIGNEVVISFSISLGYCYILYSFIRDFDKRECWKSEDAGHTEW